MISNFYIIVIIATARPCVIYMLYPTSSIKHNIQHVWCEYISLLDLRLEGGPAANIGRLEVYHMRRWGTVCDDRFGDDEARVACRQLGYEDGHVYNVSGDVHPYRSRRMRVWLDEVHCRGDEYVLHHCRHAGWENTDCNHYEDIAIACSTFKFRFKNIKFKFKNIYFPSQLSTKYMSFAFTFFTIVCQMV